MKEIIPVVDVMASLSFDTMGSEELITVSKYAAMWPKLFSVGTSVIVLPVRHSGCIHYAPNFGN